MSRLQRYFIAGLVIVLPIVASLWLLGFAFNLLTSWSMRITEYYQIEFGWYHSLAIRIILLLLMIVIISLIGAFTTWAIGAKATRLFQKVLQKIPLFNRIYGIAKQIASALALINSKNTHFSRVVVVEYPRKGLYTLGFVTNQTCKKLSGYINRDCQEKHKLYNLFIPTTPNPTSGVFIIAPASDVRELDITVEDAIKLIISGGAVSLDEVQAKELDE